MSDDRERTSTPGAAARPAKPQAPRKGVCVVSPTPRLTVTIEHRTDGEAELHLHAGGQGVWVARMCAVLGAPTTLVGTFGGETGRVLPHLIEQEGVSVTSVACTGANGSYCHVRRDDEEREVLVDVPSPPLNRHEVDDFYNAALAQGLNSKVVVLTGMANADVLPADFFGRLARDLGANGTLVTADLADESLEGLNEGVHLLKVSHEELMAGGLSASAEREDLMDAMRELRQRGIANVLVSYAEKPALALVEDRFYEVVPPRFEELDHHGAGDSMTAGTAASLAAGNDLRAALQLGAAAGALNVTRHGLGTGLQSSIELLATQVQVRPIE